MAGLDSDSCWLTSGHALSLGSDSEPLRYSNVQEGHPEMPGGCRATRDPGVRKASLRAQSLGHRLGGTMLPVLPCGKEVEGSAPGRSRQPRSQGLCEELHKQWGHGAKNNRKLPAAPLMAAALAWRPGAIFSKGPSADVT